MKTFTLRLSDGEAEALERLAYVCSKSKNSFLRDRIKTEYLETLDPIKKGVPFLFNGLDISDITPTGEWPRVYAEVMCKNAPESREAFYNAVKIYNYAVKYAKTEEDAEAHLREKVEKLEEWEAKGITAKTFDE